MPAKYDQLIIINWLNVEVDQHAIEKMPILRELSGHRNIEVYYYIKQTDAYWDRILAESV